ncbi:MAG TPA: hypothetical protein DFJ59_12000 [Alphaproteobacteria bacterium]|nr:hypothetical protein [Alphaproteobacteria bacterium]
MDAVTKSFEPSQTAPGRVFTRAAAILLALTALLILLTGCRDEQAETRERSQDFAGLMRDGQQAALDPYGLYRQTEASTLEAVAGRDLGRCASINNFWCLKTPGGAQWKGQIGADASGHAAFVDPVYSARAFARLMRIYRFRHDLVTVREVARRYAPPGDCIGSLSFCPVSEDVVIGPDKPQRQVGDQVITYSLTRPGDGFERKPLEACIRPLLYCPLGINRSEAYAATLAAALGLDSIDDDIALFDDKGRLDFTRAQTLFQAMTRFELGADYAVDPTLIRRGILMEARDYLQENQRLY